MVKFLSNLDIYGSPIRIYLNDKAKIKTNLGGLFTIFTSIIIISFSWVVGKDIILKQEPYSYTQTIYEDHYNDFLINSFSFPFSISIMDNENNVVDIEDYLDLRYEIIKNKKNVSGKFHSEILETYKFKLCNYSDFPTLEKKTFDFFYFNQMFCLVQNNNNNRLKGFWSEEEMLFINIVVSFCKKEDNSRCKDKQEIKKFIYERTLSLNIFFLDTSIVLKNFDYPITRYVNNIYRHMDFDKYKICEYELRTDKLFKDDSILFENREIIEFQKLHIFNCDTVDINHKLGDLMSFYIYSSNICNHHFRRYIRFPELLAKVGGIINACFLIFSFINNKYSKTSKYENLMRDIFYSDNNIKISSKLNNKKDYSVSNENNNFFYSNLKSHSTPTQNFFIRENKNLVEILQKRQEPYDIKFNFYEKLKILFHPILKRFYSYSFEEKILILKRGRILIKRYFDFSNLILKIQDLENLKNVLLDTEQIAVYNYLIKKRLDLDNKDSDFDNHKDNDITHIKDILIKFFKNKDVNDRINKKILKLILNKN